MEVVENASIVSNICARQNMLPSGNPRGATYFHGFNVRTYIRIVEPHGLPVLIWDIRTDVISLSYMRG